jgi:hypothetical protein
MVQNPLSTQKNRGEVGWRCGENSTSNIGSIARSGSVTNGLRGATSTQFSVANATTLYHGAKEVGSS